MKLGPIIQSEVCHLLFDTSNLPWFMDLTIPGFYAIFFFTASDFTSITSHIHNWVLFFLCFHLFILSGVISPLISSSILGNRPGDFIFQCPIFLPFHTVHGVLKARILEWFAIPFSNTNFLEHSIFHQRRQWHPTPVLLSGKSHGWRSLVGCHLWGRTELDTTKVT